MKYSRLAVDILKTEEQTIYYDPVYHGRTLKVFGIDDDPSNFLAYVGGKFLEKDYGLIFFDTRGKFSREIFDTVIKIEDGKPVGLDPIKMVKGGIMSDFFAAATIIQTVYGLDSALTNKLYADILEGKVNSVQEAAASKETYGEVIRESYTSLDEILFKGEPPTLGRNVLIDFGNAHNAYLAGIAFLIISAAVKDRRRVLIGIDDATVLFYTTPGSAAIPLLTQPSKRRVTVLGTRYTADSVLKIPGPALLLYTDPDIQTYIYDSNNVPPGELRKHVLKGEGAFIWRTTQIINVEGGELPF